MMQVHRDCTPQEGIMSDQSYTTTFSVDCTADEVLAAINNPRLVVGGDRGPHRPG